MRQLDPKAVWLFFFGFTLRLVFPLILFGIYFAAIVFKVAGEVNFLFSDFWLWIGIIAVLLTFYWIWAKLTYHFYRFEITENSFRKEHGVIWKKYVTIPYDRIQNVDIYRGLVARILGLSDLHIQTAGAITSGSYGAFAEGRLPGLSKEAAEQLRDELIQRARQFKNQGL